MMQVLLNLLSNAIKFCRAPGGRLAVSLVAEGGAMTLVVDDNGPGVAPAEREAVFEKFHQVLPQPAARPAHGTGLGLAICRRIVERHGGKIHVESSPLGGARFVVRLPASLEPPHGGS
jgi:signal transduction histidine kinase